MWRHGLDEIKRNNFHADMTCQLVNVFSKLPKRSRDGTVKLGLFPCTQKPDQLRGAATVHFLGNLGKTGKIIQGRVARYSLTIPRCCCGNHITGPLRDTSLSKKKIKQKCSKNNHHEQTYHIDQGDKVGNVEAASQIGGFDIIV